MKKLIITTFAVLITAALMAGCGAGSQTQVSTPTPSESAQVSTAVSPQKSIQETESSKEDLLSKILVTYKADTLIENGKQRMIVYVENKSGKTFTGDIHVTFKNGAKKTLGYDMLIVEDLPTGQKTYTNIYITPSNDIKMEIDFSSSYRFTLPAASMGGTVDEALSEALTQDMSAFSETTWYPRIQKIEVYDTGAESYYAVVTVDAAAEQEAVDRIGNGVFGEAAYGDGIDGTDGILIGYAKVIDPSGTVLFTKSK